MFSQSSFRNLKHKTKKGLMKRIGLTESRPEDQSFKSMLDNLRHFKTELKEIWNTSRNVFDSGKQFHEELEKFCGSGLRSEQVFFKETEFINTLGDGVCKALGSLVEKDFNMLNDLIAKYKTAKLQFDAAYFQRTKKMKKLGGPAAVKNEDNVLQTKSNLTALKQEYEASKEMVSAQRDVILSHLEEKVGQLLLELRHVSGAQHHQLCCMYFAQKLIQIAEICSDQASTEPSPLLNATFANRDMFAERSKSFNDESNSEPSTLISATFTQLIGSRTKNNNVMINRAITYPSGNGVRVEDKEEKRESIKSHSTTPEVPLEVLQDDAAAQTLLEDPESNRTSTPYQVVDTQETSGEEVLKKGIVE